MPIYEYLCDACDESHDALQKISDDALIDCPACGEPKLRKKISAAGFRLSGSGWYETDFKTGKKKNISESSAPAKDSKPAEKKAHTCSSGCSH